MRSSPQCPSEATWRPTAFGPPCCKRRACWSNRRKSYAPKRRLAQQDDFQIPSLDKLRKAAGASLPESRGRWAAATATAWAISTTARSSLREISTAHTSPFWPMPLPIARTIKARITISLGKTCSSRTCTSSFAARPAPATAATTSTPTTSTRWPRALIATTRCWPPAARRRSFSSACRQQRALKLQFTVR